MSSYVGTNFLYKSEKFLDDRQGIAKTKEDLRNWNIPVPEGFRVCLEGIWYYYDSTKTLSDTGHWIPELGGLNTIDPNKQSAPMSEINNINNDLKNIKDELGEISGNSSPLSMVNLSINAFINSSNKPILNNIRTGTLNRLNAAIISNSYIKELDKNNDGKLDNTDVSMWNQFFNRLEASSNYLYQNNDNYYVLDIGSEILPEIRWNIVQPSITWSLNGSKIEWKLVEGSDKNYLVPDNSEVQSPIPGIISTDKCRWLASDFLRFTEDNERTFTFGIMSDYKGSSVKSYAYIKFSYRNYTGSGPISFWDKSTITQSDILNLIGHKSNYTSSGGLNKTYFNCSGGKYPYILIPSKLYNPSLKTYVSGNLNSDFSIKDVTVINERGISLKFKLYRTNVIQTGSNIGIEIK